MKNIPKKIYLQIGDEDDIIDVKDFNELIPEAVSWTDVRIHENDIEYIASRPILKQSELNRLAEIGSDFIITDETGNTRLTGVGVTAILRNYLKPKK